MALIVEDGSLVLNANSYVSVRDAQKYADARGIDSLEDSEDAQKWLIRAMDYLESIEDYRGTRYSATQALQWPRENVIVQGVSIHIDSIPQRLITAQIELALVQAKGIDIFPNTARITTSPPQLKKKKVDVIEKEYFESKAAITAPFQPLSLPYVTSLLNLLRTNSSGLVFQRG